MISTETPPFGRSSLVFTRGSSLRAENLFSQNIHSIHNADNHGVYITAAASNISIVNNRIGNVADPFVTGFQKFGVKVAANVVELGVRGNDLNNNVTGPLSFASTGNYSIWGNLPSTTGVVFASLGTPANGNSVYCPDCTIANPCAGSGNGAIAKRLNNVWVCN